jgi:hypothetical protein
MYIPYTLSQMLKVFWRYMQVDASKWAGLSLGFEWNAVLLWHLTKSHEYDASYLES